MTQAHNQTQLTALRPRVRSAAAERADVCCYCGGVAVEHPARNTNAHRHDGVCRCGARHNLVSARERAQQRVAG